MRGIPSGPSGAGRSLLDAVRGVPVAVTIMVASWVTVGCSTTYQPRHSGRVSVGINHAAAVYVQNGRARPIGPFSGELEALVATVPEAKAHAHTAHTQFMVGIPAYLSGALGVIVGVVVLSGPVGWVVIGAGASILGTGLGFMGAGLTHAIDAVNTHNDKISTP